MNCNDCSYQSECNAPCGFQISKNQTLESQLSAANQEIAELREAAKAACSVLIDCDNCPIEEECMGEDLQSKCYYSENGKCSAALMDYFINQAKSKVVK